MSSLARRAPPLSAASAEGHRPPGGLGFVAVSTAMHLAVAGLLAWAPARASEAATPAEISFAVLEEEDPPSVAPVALPAPPEAPVLAPTPVVPPRVRAAPRPLAAPAEPRPGPEVAPSSGITSTAGGLAVGVAEGGGEAPLAPTPARAVGSAAAPPRVEPSAGPDPRALARAWMDRVNRTILERAVRDYPRAARRAELEGTVLVAISVAPDGRITAVRLESGAGHDALDRAALAAVEAVGQLPPPPELFTRRGRPLTMPITYRLR